MIAWSSGRDEQSGASSMLESDALCGNAARHATEWRARLHISSLARTITLEDHLSVDQVDRQEARGAQAWLVRQPGEVQP